jgi:hypothetical protein
MKKIELQGRFMDFCESNEIDKEKYFLNYTNTRSGNFAVIMKHDPSGSISFAGDGGFYDYGALSAWMDGYTAAKRNLYF